MLGNTCAPCYFSVIIFSSSKGLILLRNATKESLTLTPSTETTKENLTRTLFTEIMGMNEAAVPVFPSALVYSV